MKAKLLIALLVASGAAYLLMAEIDKGVLLSTLGKSLYISCPGLALMGLSLKIKKKIYSNVLIIGFLLVVAVGARIAIAIKHYDLQGMIMAAIAELSVVYLAYVLVRGLSEKRKTEGASNMR